MSKIERVVKWETHQKNNKKTKKTQTLTWQRTFRAPSNKRHVSSPWMISSPGAPNERALKQGCNLRELNHWPVLIGRKHVTAELGHSSPCMHIKQGDLRSSTGWHRCCAPQLSFVSVTCHHLWPCTAACRAAEKTFEPTCLSAVGESVWRRDGENGDVLSNCKGKKSHLRGKEFLLKWEFHKKKIKSLFLHYLFQTFCHRVRKDRRCVCVFFVFFFFSETKTKWQLSLLFCVTDFSEVSTTACQHYPLIISPSSFPRCLVNARQKLEGVFKFIFGSHVSAA